MMRARLGVRSRARLAATLGVLLAAAGCGHSPPTRILTIDPAPPAPGGVRADYRGPPIAVASVRVPAAMDRAEFVAETAPATLRLSDFDRWAAPLDTLARDALVRDLVARLPEGTVVPPGVVVPTGARRFDVAILSFNATGGQAAMEVAYGAGPGGARRQTVLTAPSGPAPADAAAALGVLIGRLADLIVAYPAR